MGFFRRLVGRGEEPAPDWASFFTAGEYRAFLDAVTADLRRRNVSFRLGDGAVEVELRGGPHQFGLSNLSQLCHAAGREEWSATIASHFSTMLAIQGRDHDALAADFEQAARILRLRFHADDALPPGYGGAVRQVATGLILALVYDYPDSVASVNTEHLAQWDLPEDEVYAIATRNTLAEPLPVRETIPVAGRPAASFEAYLGDSFYVASRALGMADLLPPEAVHGAVIALPHRHALLWHPIVDVRVLGAVQAMIGLADVMYREGPGSITNQLYWWRAGSFTHLPVRTRKGGTDFFPPDSFLEVLNGLPESPTAG